jgi:hypothetical protein
MLVLQMQIRSALSYSYFSLIQYSAWLINLTYTGFESFSTSSRALGRPRRHPLRNKTASTGVSALKRATILSSCSKTHANRRLSAVVLIRLSWRLTLDGVSHFGSKFAGLETPSNVKSILNGVKSHGKDPVLSAHRIFVPSLFLVILFRGPRIRYYP